MSQQKIDKYKKIDKKFDKKKNQLNFRMGKNPLEIQILKRLAQ